MKRTVLLLLLMLYVLLLLASGNTGGTAGPTTTRFLIDDRIRNNFARDDNGMFFVTTFGLERYREEYAGVMPEEKPGRLIKFGIQNSDTGWQFINTQIVNMEINLTDPNGDPFNPNAYTESDYQDMCSNPNFVNTKRFRFYGGTGCWASPVLLNNTSSQGGANSLLVLNKSGMLMNIESVFTTLSGYNARARLIWNIDLRDYERSVPNQTNYEYMSTPTVYNGYIYVAGIRNIFRIDLNTLNVTTLDVTLSNTDYMFAPIIFDAGNDDDIVHFYTTTHEGKVISFTGSLSNISIRNSPAELYAPPLVDTDGHVYLAGGRRESSYGSISSFNQSNRPSAYEFQGYREFNALVGEFIDTGSPFTSTMLTDKSKNLYMFDDNHVHYYPEKYIEQNIALNDDPISYVGCTNPIQLEINGAYRMFGNHSTLYERTDMNKSLVYTINNSHSTGYLSGLDPFYPEDTDEANLSSCSIFDNFVAFYYNYQINPAPVLIDGHAFNHNQSWGGITPYLANDYYYNGIFGDECGSVTSYNNAFGLNSAIFPNTHDNLPLFPVTSYTKFMKNNENVIHYSIVPQFTVYFYDSDNPNTPMTNQDISRVYMNSYYQNTVQCGTGDPTEFANGLKVVYNNMLNHPNYTITYMLNDGPTPQFCYHYPVNINPFQTFVSIDISHVVEPDGFFHFYPEDNGTATNILSNGGTSNEILPPILIHADAIVIVSGWYSTPHLIMYEGSQLLVQDGIHPFTAYITDCLQNDPDYPGGELNPIIFNPSGPLHSGKYNFQNNISIGDNASYGLEVKFIGYGVQPVTYNIGTLINKWGSTVRFLHHELTSLLNLTADIISIQNRGKITINDNIACDNIHQYRDSQIYYGQLIIGSNSDIGGTYNSRRRGRLEIRDWYDISGVLTVGFDEIASPNLAILELNSCTGGISCLNNEGPSTAMFFIKGAFNLLGENSCKLMNGLKLLFYPKSELNLNGGTGNANGSELVAYSNGSKICFGYTTGFNVPHQSVKITGYKNRLGQYYGDRVRAMEGGAILGHEIANFYATNDFKYLTVLSTNPNSNIRWEGIISNANTGAVDYSMDECNISGIEKFYLKNHHNFIVTTSNFTNCTYGLFFDTNPVCAETQTLTVTNSNFNGCTNGIYIIESDGFHTSKPLVMFANIDNCRFGVLNQFNTYNDCGISLYRCAGAKVINSDFYENNYGIFGLESRILVGGDYNEFGFPVSDILDYCVFYNNFGAGIYLEKSTFKKSLIINNQFNSNDPYYNTGIGIRVSDVVADIMKNHIVGLPAHGFLGNFYTRGTEPGSRYHGFSGNHFINNGGCELIGDAMSLSNLYVSGTHTPNTITDLGYDPNIHGEVIDPLKDFDEWDYYILANIERDFDPGNLHTIADVRGNIITPLPETVQNRFYPVYEAFIFTNPEESPLRNMINNGISLFYLGQFDEAKDIMKNAVCDFPDSVLTKFAVDFMYLIESCTGEDYETLRAYLDLNIDSVDLATYIKKEEIKTKCYISEKDYPTAIQRLQLIINNPETIVDSLYALIDQAYCYLCLAEEDPKSLPNCSAKTPTFDSYIALLQKLDIAKPTTNTTPGLTEKLNLLTNYPNPFNPETTIRFQTPKEGKIKLEIYNLKGQKVKTLLNGNLQKGNHKIVWNGKDENDKVVSSGMYFTRLEQNGVVKSGKMIMLK